MLLLLLYRSKSRTLAYLMPQAYSKFCQMFKMMRHIKNPGIDRTVNSGIFRHIHGHSTMFSHVQAYLGTLRHSQAYSDIIEAY